MRLGDNLGGGTGGEVGRLDGRLGGGDLGGGGGGAVEPLNEEGEKDLGRVRAGEEGRCTT